MISMGAFNSMLIMKHTESSSYTPEVTWPANNLRQGTGHRAPRGVSELRPHRGIIAGVSPRRPNSLSPATTAPFPAASA